MPTLPGHLGKSKVGMRRWQNQGADVRGLISKVCLSASHDMPTHDEGDSQATQAGVRGETQNAVQNTSKDDPAFNRHLTVCHFFWQLVCHAEKNPG